MAVRSALFALALWLAFGDFYSNFANANLTVRPTDTVVLVNQTTYFNCSTSARDINTKFVLWYHYPVNSPTRKDVYDEGNIMHEYKDRFRMETDFTAGVFNLVAERPNLTDAGKYECQDGVGQGDKASAELIVAEGNPICESNIHSDGVVGPNSCGLKPDELWMTCHITSFHGNKPPTLEWKRSNDESSPSLVVCASSASCNLTQRGDEIRDGQSFVCQITKSTEQYGCSTAVVKVRYAMSRTEEIIEAKGDVKCYANTSQPCTYKWYNTKDEEVSSHENLQTTIRGEYKCEAQCEMNRQNESCSFIAMRVYIVSPDNRSYSLFVLLLIPPICIVCLYIVYRYKRSVIRKGRYADVNISLVNQDTSTLDCRLPTSPGRLPTSPGHLQISSQDMVDKLTINQYFIDRGTSGVIYGPFMWTDKKYALKQIMYSPDKVTEEKKLEIAQLRDRCRKLDHPHLAKVFEVWFQSPALYILMEYAEGKSLDKILRPKDATAPLQPFSFEVVEDWALQIADGMKYLHENKLVHRNLKAAHVLVMESADVLPNTLKIGSYTLTREHDHSTVMSLKGTMAWMAPEYIRGEEFSVFSDVWSYGVTVWEILARDVPYKEIKKETDLVRAAMNKTLKLIMPESCPEQLQAVLTDCWNYEVKERPSFTQICDRLRSIKII